MGEGCLAELLGRREVESGDPLQLVEDARGRLADHREQEVLFGVDVVVEAALAHADLDSNVLERCSGETLLLEHLGGSVDHVIPTARPRHRFSSC